MLRTEFIDKLEKGAGAGMLVRAIRSAMEFKAMEFKKEWETTWGQMIREGRALRKTHDLSWSQVIMAAITLILLRTATVEGRTDIGVMASGKVVGLIDDIPPVGELLARLIRESYQRLGISLGRPQTH